MLYKWRGNYALTDEHEALHVQKVLTTSGDKKMTSIPYPFFLPNFTKTKFFRVVVSFAP
jgi:hypothetical protein